MKSLLAILLCCTASGQLSAVVERENVAISESFLSAGVLGYLGGRLDQLDAAGHSGASSFFVSFRDQPRSAIEYVIVNHIAPRVFGRNGFAYEVGQGLAGAEWWIQYRNSSSPKEYHLDTAISYCEKHGMAPASNCPFYPRIGSVFYLGNDGGPTVIFNQTMTDRGLSPTLSTFVSVVPPKLNRMLLFKGSLLHGVIGDDENKTRRTLLINYWYDKTAGSEQTVVLEDEPVHIRHVEELVIAEGGPDPLFYTPVTFQSERSFAADFDIWRSQRVPAQLYASIESLVVENSAHSLSLFSLDSSPFNIAFQDNHINGHFDFIFSTLGVKDFVVGNWVLWELSRANGTFKIASLDRGRYLDYYV